MIFKTVPDNIPQIVKAVNAFGKVWFHGDGNIYNDKKNSDDRVSYSNPKDEEAKYRIEFNRGDAIPMTVHDLNEMLLKSKNNEIMQDRISVEHNHVQMIPA